MDWWFLLEFLFEVVFTVEIAGWTIAEMWSLIFGLLCLTGALVLMFGIRGAEEDPNEKS